MSTFTKNVSVLLFIMSVAMTGFADPFSDESLDVECGDHWLSLDIGVNLQQKTATLAETGDGQREHIYASSSSATVKGSQDNYTMYLRFDQADFKRWVVIRGKQLNRVDVLVFDHAYKIMSEWNSCQANWN